MKETTNLSMKELREIRKSALERHRLYLLAKNDYEQFKQQVGVDKAARFFAELKKTSKFETKIANIFDKDIVSADYVYTLDERSAYVGSIMEDAKRYMSGSAGRTSLKRMKLHLTWAFLSNLFLLVLSLIIGVTPWISGFPPGEIELSSLVVSGSIFIASFLIFLWYVKNIMELDVLGWRISFRLDKSGKEKLLFIAAPFLIYYIVSKYGDAMNLGSNETVLYSSISISIIAASHFLLILDCMTSLGCREYYIGPEGIIEWIKGWFNAKKRRSLYSVCTASICNNYNDGRSDYAVCYRDAELRALKNEMRKNRFCFLGNSLSGTMQFHPSSSIKFIIAYIFVDIIHTCCIALWMITLIAALVDLDTIYLIMAAALSCVIIYVMLDKPVYATNRLNWYICKNLFAYKVSHLFRKLFYSFILLSASVLLIVYCIPAK